MTVLTPKWGQWFIFTPSREVRNGERRTAKHKVGEVVSQGRVRKLTSKGGIWGSRVMLSQIITMRKMAKLSDRMIVIVTESSGIGVTIYGV